MGWNAETFRRELADRIGGDRLSMCDEDMFRSGHGSGRSEERDLHADSRGFAATGMIPHAATDLPVVDHRRRSDCG